MVAILIPPSDLAMTKKRSRVALSDDDEDDVFIDDTVTAYDIVTPGSSPVLNPFNYNNKIEQQVIQQVNNIKFIICTLIYNLFVSAMVISVRWQSLKSKDCTRP